MKGNEEEEENEKEYYERVDKMEEGDIEVMVCGWIDGILKEEVKSKQVVDVLMRCSLLICRGNDPEESFSKLKSTICGTIWKDGDDAYKCVQCGIDPSSAICVDCWTNDCHVGHDYTLCTVAGGVCDCGDPHSWKPSGTCPNHGGGVSLFQSHHGMIESLGGVYMNKCFRAVTSSLLMRLNVLLRSIADSLDSDSDSDSDVAIEKALLIADYLRFLCTKADSYRSLMARIWLGEAPNQGTSLLDEAMSLYPKLPPDVTERLHRLFYPLLTTEGFRREFLVRYFMPNYRVHSTNRALSNSQLHHRTQFSSPQNDTNNSPNRVGYQRLFDDFPVQLFTVGRDCSQSLRECNAAEIIVSKCLEILSAASVFCRKSLIRKDTSDEHALLSYGLCLDPHHDIIKSRHFARFTMDLRSVLAKTDPETARSFFLNNIEICVSSSINVRLTGFEIVLRCMSLLHECGRFEHHPPLEQQKDGHNGETNATHSQTCTVESDADGEGHSTESYSSSDEFGIVVESAGTDNSWTELFVLQLELILASRVILDSLPPQNPLQSRGHQTKRQSCSSPEGLALPSFAAAACLSQITTLSVPSPLFPKLSYAGWSLNTPLLKCFACCILTGLKQGVNLQEMLPSDKVWIITRIPMISSAFCALAASSSTSEWNSVYDPEEPKSITASSDMVDSNFLPTHEVPMKDGTWVELRDARRQATARFSSHFRDLSTDCDTFLLQCSLAVLCQSKPSVVFHEKSCLCSGSSGTNRFCLLLAGHFGVLQAVCGRAPNEKSIKCGKMTAELLRFVGRIARDRSKCGMSPDQLLRHELIHALAVEDLPHSRLSTSGVRAELKDLRSFDSILGSIARRKSDNNFIPSNQANHGSFYSLRVSSWEEFDPFFANYDCSSREAALERMPSSNSRNTEGVDSFGKHVKNDLHSVAQMAFPPPPLPIPPFPQFSHGLFSLLDCDVLLAICFLVLFSALHPGANKNLGSPKRAKTSSSCNHPPIDIQDRSNHAQSLPDEESLLICGPPGLEEALPEALLFLRAAISHFSSPLSEQQPTMSEVAADHNSPISPLHPWCQTEFHGTKRKLSESQELTLCLCHMTFPSSKGIPTNFHQKLCAEGVISLPQLSSLSIAALLREIALQREHHDPRNISLHEKMHRAAAAACLAELGKGDVAARRYIEGLHSKAAREVHLHGGIASERSEEDDITEKARKNRMRERQQEVMASFKKSIAAFTAPGSDNNEGNQDTIHQESETPILRDKEEQEWCFRICGTGECCVLCKDVVTECGVGLRDEPIGFFTLYQPTNVLSTWRNLTLHPPDLSELFLSPLSSNEPLPLSGRNPKFTDETSGSDSEVQADFEEEDEEDDDDSTWDIAEKDGDRISMAYNYLREVTSNDLEDEIDLEDVENGEDEGEVNAELGDIEIYFGDHQVDLIEDPEVDEFGHLDEEEEEEDLEGDSDDEDRVSGVVDDEEGDSGGEGEEEEEVEAEEEAEEVVEDEEEDGDDERSDRVASEHKVDIDSALRRWENDQLQQDLELLQRENCRLERNISNFEGNFFPELLSEGKEKGKRKRKRNQETSAPLDEERKRVPLAEMEILDRRLEELKEEIDGLAQRLKRKTRLAEKRELNLPSTDDKPKKDNYADEIKECFDLSAQADALGSRIDSMISMGMAGNLTLFSPDISPGLAVVRCGSTSGSMNTHSSHLVHLSCRERYLNSLIERRDNGESFEGEECADPSRGQCLCPACRSLSNCFLPIIPFFTCLGPTNPIHSPSFFYQDFRNWLDSIGKPDPSDQILEFERRWCTVNDTPSNLSSQLEKFVEAIVMAERRCWKYVVTPNNLTKDCHSGGEELASSLVLWANFATTLYVEEMKSRKGLPIFQENQGAHHPLPNDEKRCEVCPFCSFRSIQSPSSNLGYAPLPTNVSEESKRRLETLFFASMGYFHLKRMTPSLTTSYRPRLFALSLLPCDLDFPLGDETPSILSRDIFGVLLQIIFLWHRPSMLRGSNNASGDGMRLAQYFFHAQLAQILLERFYFSSQQGLTSQQFNEYIRSTLDCKAALTDIQSHMCTFLRRCYLLLGVCLDGQRADQSSIPSTSVDSSSQEFCSLSEWLGMPSIKSALTEGLPLVSAFISSILGDKVGSDWSQPPGFVWKGLQPANIFSVVPPSRVRLISLPHSYHSLLKKYSRARCTRCCQTPPTKALCLLCGALLCAGNSCCRSLGTGHNSFLRGGSVGIGECTTHGYSCGGNFSLFLILRLCAVLVIRCGRHSFWPSPYLDEHGEEDVSLARGKPLFLSEFRYSLLNDLYVNHTLEFDQHVSEGTTLQETEWY